MEWNAHPTALVTGRIALEDGCLLLGDSVVFWPQGTTWDDERQSIEFGGDFETSAPTAVGEEYTGSGGSYSARNLEGLVGLDAETLLRCIRETGADGAVFAYPAT